MAKLKAFLASEAFRYLFFGGLTTIVSVGSYQACRWLAIDYQAATLISWVLAVTFAFVTNKLFVFESRNLQPSLVIKEAASFYSCRLMSLAFEFVFMIICVDFLHIHDFVAKCLTQVFILILNYLFSKFLIFRKKE